MHRNQTIDRNAYGDHLPYVTISHDAFGRWELVRTISAGGECAWCDRRARFTYGIDRDGRPYRPTWDSKSFCSVGCRRSYYSA